MQYTQLHYSHNIAHRGNWEYRSEGDRTGLLEVHGLTGEASRQCNLQKAQAGIMGTDMGSNCYSLYEHLQRSKWKFEEWEVHHTGKSKSISWKGNNLSKGKKSVKLNRWYM